MQQVLVEIDKDEPDYAAAAKLGPEALPHLQLIIEADDPLRASKAAYAAGLIGGPAAVGVMRKAAEHHDPQVRMAAALGLRNSADSAPTEILAGLLDDHDAGVRKTALATAGHLKRSDLNEKVASMAEHDPEQFLREAASVAKQPRR